MCGRQAFALERNTVTAPVSVCDDARKATVIRFEHVTVSGLQRLAVVGV